MIDKNNEPKISVTEEIILFIENYHPKSSDTISSAIFLMRYFRYNPNGNQNERLRWELTTTAVSSSELETTFEILKNMHCILLEDNRYSLTQRGKDLLRDIDENVKIAYGENFKYIRNRSEKTIISQARGLFFQETSFLLTDRVRM